MASSREKSLATIQEAQTAVSEVLGRIRFNTATFREWNKVQATGRHLSQYKCRKNDLNWHESSFNPRTYTQIHTPTVVQRG